MLRLCGCWFLGRNGGLLYFYWTKINIVDSGRWLLRHWCFYIVSDFVSSDPLDQIIFIRSWIRIDLLVLKHQILTERKPIVVILRYPRWIVLAPQNRYLSLLWLQASLFIIETYLALFLHHGIHLLHKHFRTIFFYKQSTLHRRKHRLHPVIFFLDENQLLLIVLT